MRAAADDLATSGRVAELFVGVPVPPGSAPALRLLAALHHLVLSGRAPELAAFYPSAGGGQPPNQAWPAALQVLTDHAEWIHDRLERMVQTNDPGRATVLFGALLWLAQRHSLPVRLLEIGASAGLNLLVDRFCYVVDHNTLGTPTSPVRFVEPWVTPELNFNLKEAADRLQIVSREGCDPFPLNPRDPEARMTALSYIWPDELDRFERTRAALALAAEDPPRLVAQRAETWLPSALAAEGYGHLTVVWQSVVRQYVEPIAWQMIESAFSEGFPPGNKRPVVWLRMEPGDCNEGFQLTMKHASDEPPRLLARCLDHGPPVIWKATA